MKKAIAGLMALFVLGGFAAGANAGSRWAHFFDRRTGNVVVIKEACLQAEDSAGHLKLIDYRDGGGTIVYGCYRRGY